MKTIHHWVSKSSWWSNNKCNLHKVNDRYHKYFHWFFKTILPHLCLILVLKLTGKPLEEKVKNDIMDILNKEPRELYKTWTIKDIDKFNKSIESSKWIFKI